MRSANGRSTILLLLLLMGASTVSEVQGGTWQVSTTHGFNAAQNAAAPGDTILWADGVYYNVWMVISKSGLTVMARTPGKTIFTGASRLTIQGNDNCVAGFQYRSGNISTDHVVIISGSRNRLHELNIQDYYCRKYLIIEEGTSFNEISYCNFEHRTYKGDHNILSVLVDPLVPGYHSIRYCSFRNFPGGGGDEGVEPIRIGLSSQGDFISRTTVEYCYFTQCNGDGEIISHKSRQNVYRYNTFEDNPVAELVLRHGDEGVVYGNFFLNGMGGVRIKEGRHHAVFNNYFSGLTRYSIHLQNYQADPLGQITLAYNTFVNSATLNLGASGLFPPSDITFANNLFANASESLLSDATGNETWTGNIAQGNLGIPRPDGIDLTDPLLSENEWGFFGLSQGSPAIDSAKAGYPDLPDYPDMGIDSEVLMDLMQQKRPASIPAKDVGCSEYPHEIVIRPHVDGSNTGPSYLREENHVFVLRSVVGKGPVLMTTNKEVIARFEAFPVCQVAIFANGPGGVEIEPQAEEYAEGTHIILHGVPDTGFVFSHWGGQAEGTENLTGTTVLGNMVLTADFIADSTAGFKGRVAADPGIHNQQSVR